jgi:hypothetical protein
MNVTHWIRSRAEQGQPLNLHAVMRERPDILENVFAGQSPLGWRKSLIAAGVDPFKIAHEIQDYVECAVCGKSYKVIGAHLIAAHQLTGEEYRREYGSDCEVSSEAFRARKFDNKTILGIAHWERLWSRYYVIDYIICLHEKGFDLNFFSVSNHFRNLSNMGIFYFGSWNAALLAAGFDPEVLRRHPPGLQWSQSKVILALKELEKVKRTNPRAPIKNALGMAIARYFESTEVACIAAGVDFKVINPYAAISRESIEGVIAEIRTLMKSTVIIQRTLGL